MKSVLSLVILFFATSTVLAHPHSHHAKKDCEVACKKDCKDCKKECQDCKCCKKDCKDCKCENCNCNSCLNKLKSVVRKPFKVVKKVVKALKD